MYLLNKKTQSSKIPITIRKIANIIFNVSAGNKVTKKAEMIADIVPIAATKSAGKTKTSLSFINLYKTKIDITTNEKIFASCAIF